MILDKILTHKRQEVVEAKRAQAESELKSRLNDVPPARGFARALRSKAQSAAAIIAEVKKGSPSKGIIREDFDPVAIARDYRRGGAACLSVLTDRRFFFGDLDYLPRIAAAVDLPLLRKDFIVDPYQVVEARVHRADAILLIAAALENAELGELAALATDLGMDVLLEVHTEEELARVRDIPVALVGINNRDLNTFVTDLAVTERLCPLVPEDRLVVAESGIGSRADIDRLLAAGAGAFLIGESLMREGDVAAKLASLVHAL